MIMIEVIPKTLFLSMIKIDVSGWFQALHMSLYTTRLASWIAHCCFLALLTKRVWLFGHFTLVRRPHAHSAFLCIESAARISRWCSDNLS